jgi:hypothetical protein
VDITPDRNDEAPTDRQLLLQGFGHLRAAGGHQYCIELRLLGQALGAVGADDLDIGITKRLEAPTRELGKLVVALYRVDLASDAAHHRRRIARARADLEHLVAWLELEQLDHAGDDVRLRDGLPRLDGQSRILVGEFLQRVGHEGLARDPAHGGKHKRIGDAARFEMVRDHDGAVARMLVLRRGRSGGGKSHAK